MKAVRIIEPFKVECIDVPKPEPKKGEALLKIEAAGICGSDIGAFRGVNNLVSYPRIIGHELSGVIVSIPDDNNPKGLKPGDRVVVDPYLHCDHCYPCRIGRTNCCIDLKTLGVHVASAETGPAATSTPSAVSATTVSIPSIRRRPSPSGQALKSPPTGTTSATS